MQPSLVRQTEGPAVGLTVLVNGIFPMEVSSELKDMEMTFIETEEIMEQSDSIEEAILSRILRGHSAV